MSCCSPAAELADAMIDRSRTANDELLLASRDIGEGLRQTDLSVPAIHCGGCIQTIEKALGALPGVEQARVNLSSRRVTIRWRADGTPPPLIETLRAARIRSASLRYCRGFEGRRHGGTGPCARRRRLCGQQHHAAVGLGLVRRGARNPRPVPLDFGADRASRRWPIRDASSSARPGKACATARPTWTFRSPSASCSRSR